MDKSLTVSVIVPAYNAEAYVGEAVTSVLEQTYSPVEVICVDDGSTDNTLDIFRSLEAKHPDLVRVLAGPNSGAPAARNKGLAAARGEYVQFLDADDVLMPEKLAHQVALIGASKDQPDFIAGAYIRQPFEKDIDDGYVVRVHEEDHWIALLSAQLGCTISNLWRRGALLEVRGWAEECRSSQDADLMFRMLRSGAAVLVDQRPTAVARRRGDSIWNGDLEASIERSIDLRSKMLAYLDEAGILSAKRRATADAVLFERIRNLYGRNPRSAAALHRHIIQSSFDPARVGYGRGYGLVYRYAGFVWAERYSRIRQMTPLSFKRVVSLATSRSK